MTNRDNQRVNGYIQIIIACLFVILMLTLLVIPKEQQNINLKITAPEDTNIKIVTPDGDTTYMKNGDTAHIKNGKIQIEKR
jgi:hypothetical protein